MRSGLCLHPQILRSVCGVRSGTLDLGELNMVFCIPETSAMSGIPKFLRSEVELTLTVRRPSMYVCEVPDSATTLPIKSRRHVSRCPALHSHLFPPFPCAFPSFAYAYTNSTQHLWRGAFSHFSNCFSFCFSFSLASTY